MKYIIRKGLDTRLPRPVVGCALQGDKFLALSVSGSRADGWRIHWYHAGRLGNAEKIAELAAKVGSAPFWTTPRKDGAAQRDFAFAADLPDDVALSERERALAMRTQVEARFANVAEAVEFGGVDMRGGFGRHLVAFGAVKSVVDGDFRFWRRQCHIREPHIASPAAAIANLYATLCPQEFAVDNKMHIVILEGRVTTTAVVMDGGKLIDAIEYEMLEGQTLDEYLVQDWVEYARKRHPALAVDPVPIVISASDKPGFTVWNPLGADSPISADGPEMLSELGGEMGFAAMAFGMALQGGV